ncbi:MAG: carbohydrate-binding domain-containing protein [Bacteroidales bacterium]|nr:carbohydrate-binding domain-containing protein [Bacteroidales bacterium]
MLKSEKLCKKKASLLLIGYLTLIGFSTCQISNRDQSPSGDPQFMDRQDFRRNIPVAGDENAFHNEEPADAVKPAVALEPAGDQEADYPLVYYPAVADALRDNQTDHEDAGDDDWNDAGAVQIILNGKTINISGKGAIADGSIVTITAAGTYILSGRLSDGRIIVSSDDKGTVKLVLNGVDISCATSSPVYIQNAGKAIIIVSDQTENHIADGASYVFENPDETEPNAAIFSKADLSLYGRGKLTVEGNYNDGIASKDGLIISNSNITVHAVDDGIRGKDYLVVKSGNIKINAGGDGLKSDHSEDADKGYVYIRSGTIDIHAGGDAIQGVTDVLLATGDFTLVSGSSKLQSSGKGISADVNTIIDGGNLSITSVDDGVHSNGSIVINGGSLLISTNDDGIHADSMITINKGNINITESYEGIESKIVTINDGDIRVVSSDDGLNAAVGNQGFGMGRRPPGPGDRGGRGGGFGSFGNCFLYINGGHIVVDANGDGIDINGSVVMTGGNLIVNGPTADFNSALDYDGYFTLSEGFLVAAGSARMAQIPGNTSTQNSLLLNFQSAQQAGTLFHIQTSSGKKILTFVPSKRYQSIAFSSPDLITGTSYDVFTGGRSTGSPQYGLYHTGSYTPGIKYASFTLSGNVTRLTK